MTGYDDELRDLREKISRKAKIGAMLSSLQAQLEELQGEKQRLAEIMRREQADVDRLEKPGLASLFYAVINQKDEKLDKEKAEAYAAAVKYNTAVRQVEAVEYDINSLKEERISLSDIETRYEKVFAQKLAELKCSDPAHADGLKRIEERLDFVAAQAKEIDEAFSAGQYAISQIAAIEEDLNSAEGWGMWDIIGGGMISGIAKHSYLDSAQGQIDELQVLLRRYSTELSDVEITVDIQAQINDMLRFADFFFDGLIADWAVQSRINDSQQQIANTRAQVEHVQSRLAGMKEKLTAEAKGLKAQLDNIVLK